MSVAESHAAELAIEQPTAGLWSDAWDRFKRNPAALVGAGLILIFVIAAIFAPAIAPFDPQEQAGKLSANPEGPGDGHLMGLDKQGRDYFSRMQGFGIVASMKDFYWDIRPKPEYFARPREWGEEVLDPRRGRRDEAPARTSSILKTRVIVSGDSALSLYRAHGEAT